MTTKSGAYGEVFNRRIFYGRGSSISYVLYCILEFFGVHELAEDQERLQIAEEQEGVRREKKRGKKLAYR